MRPALLLLVLLVAVRVHAAEPHVYLVIVDGLDPELVTTARMPTLFALIAGEKARSTLFRDASAVMPTRTNHGTSWVIFIPGVLGR